MFRFVAEHCLHSTLSSISLYHFEVIIVILNEEKACWCSMFKQNGSRTGLKLREHFEFRATNACLPRI